MGDVIGHIVYDGVDSRDFGVIVSSIGTHKAPKRVVENIEIPGRNGTLTIDGGKFENIIISYVGMILHDFSTNFDAFKAFLLSKTGYKRLEDSFNPDYFRLAKVYDEIDPAVVTWDAAGRFEIPFDCDPRRFLKSGEDFYQFTIEQFIYNPTSFDAKPLLLVYGNGTITFNGAQITISNNDSYIYIDMETLNAYDLSTNRNDKVSISGNPVLIPGENRINASNTLTDIYLYPRWWTI